MKHIFSKKIVLGLLAAATISFGAEFAPIISGIEPTIAYANTGNYTAPVTFVTRQGEVQGSFTAATDTLGFQTVNPDGEDVTLLGFRVGKRYLVAWADHADVNQATNVYFLHQTIGDVYPEGIPADAKLYAIYGEISPLTMNSLFSNNQAYINQGLTAEQTLPGTTIKEANGNDITAVYNPSKDKYFVHFSDTFKLNRTLSLLTYVNKGGIITNSESEWNTNQGAKFNHVDLHVSIPEQLEAKPTQYFEFESNNFYPYAVMTDYGQPVEVLDPVTETPVDLSTLTTNSSNKTAFKFRLNGAKNFIIRTRPRSSGDFSKKLTNISTAELFEDYTLRSLDKEAFWITKDVASQMADNALEATASGYVDGYAQPAAQQTAIPKIIATPLKIKFVKDDTTELYIGINKAGHKGLKTDDGKAIFVFGNSYQNGTNRNYNEFDLEYTVYTNAGLTDIVTVNTPVKWTVEAIAGFENSPAVVSKAQEMLQYKTGDTSTYTVGQANYNHAKALKSGIYKVTASLENGRSDHAYIVVPGDTDRSGILSGRDSSMFGRYIAASNINVFPHQDDFTLYLADIDGSGVVQGRDVRLVNQMIGGLITSN